MDRRRREAPAVFLCGNAAAVGRGRTSLLLTLLTHLLGLAYLRRKEVNSMTSLLASWIDRMRNDEAGQGLAEYALILALIAVISIIALIYLGTQISDKLSVIGDAL